MILTTRRILMIAFTILLCYTAPAQNREKKSINSGWQFILNDAADISSTQKPNQYWQKINLPHTWNAVDILDDTVGYHQGIGWYRKELTLTKEYSNKHLELFFEGACNKTSVYINGRIAGEHEGGFTGFKINLDGHVSFDKLNEILVKVDNGKYLQEKIPPFSGDFNLMGGIYRDAWLTVSNKIHFDGTFGSSGIFFSIDDINEKKASFKIAFRLNDYQNAENLNFFYQLTLNKSVVTEKEKVIAITTSKKTLLALSGAINNPQLWSPEKPTLYQLLVQLKNHKGEVIDEIIQHVGFKWVSISDKKQFLLNGKPYILKGASRHQDYDRIGNALPDALHVKDIQLMKDMGCNFLRIAHYPQDPAIYDACDKLGLLAWSEIPVVDRVVNNEDFFRTSKLMMQEMIWQNYNHPCIAIWGYHNEVRNLEPSTIAHAKMLDSIAKTLDKQRLTAMAYESNLDIPYFSNPLLRQLLNIPDINGYNVYQGWYRGKYQNISSFLDTLYGFNPSKPIMLSEYGAGSNTNIHTTAPTIFDFSEEYSCLFHEAYLKAGNIKPWMIGFAIWNFIDFQRDGREDVSPNINNKGMVTTDRKPKDVYYFYKSQWSKEPFVYITGKNWTNRTAIVSTIYPHQQLMNDVVVYSNQQGIKLFCNGKMIAPSSTGNGKFIFSVPFKQGANNLSCQSADGKLSDAFKVHYDILETTNFSKNTSWSQLNFNIGQSRTFFSDPRSDEQWLPDKTYIKGSWGYVGGEIWNTWPSLSWNGIREGVHKPITNTENDALFQTFVEGLNSWKADVPDGTYRVKLLLCEPFTPLQRNNQERIMDVFLNGNVWCSSLNLEKEFGVLTAAEFEKEVMVKNGKGIEVNFNASSGKTILNGISIKKL
jgi:beta-galactosidase